MEYPYQDRTKSIAERVKIVLSRMIIEEEVAQLHAFRLILSEDGRHQPRSNDEFTRSSDPDRLHQLLSLRYFHILLTRPISTPGLQSQIMSYAQEIAR